MRKLLITLLLLLALTGCNNTKKDEETEVPEVHYTLQDEMIGDYEVFLKHFTYPEDYVKCEGNERFSVQDEFYEREFTFDCSGEGLVLKVGDVYQFLDRAFEDDLITKEEILATNYGVRIELATNKKILTLENALLINDSSEYISYVKTMYIVDGHAIYDLRVKSGASMNDSCLSYEDVVHSFVNGEEIIEVRYETCTLLGFYVEIDDHLYRVDQAINTLDMTIEEFISVGLSFQ